MISFDEAQALLLAEARPLGSETVPLAEAAGRWLAEPVTAALDQPRADQSAMDGYAVRAGDAESIAGTLRLIGEAQPGAPFAGTVGPGEAVRIFTGAAVPQGADRVLVQEIVAREGDRIRLSGNYGVGRHIRPAASDFATGARLLEAGQKLHPRAMLAAAAADRATLSAWRAPRVALISSGNELVAPGEAAATDHAIAESLSIALAGMLPLHGGVPASARRVRDDLAALERAAGEALAEADLVVTTGGASVGEHDHAKAMFEAHGLDLVFSKVAIKPGKPVWFGRAGGKLVLGLPGNPTSAMVTARLFLAPLLTGLAGGDSSLRWHTLPIEGDLPATGTRETFRRARAADGRLVMSGSNDSGAQAALVHVDRLVRCPAGNVPIAAGTPLPALDF